MEQLQINYDAIAVEQVLAQVEENSDQQWRDLALEAVRKTCLTLPNWISDDIWRVADLPSTREDRALGPVLMKAARLGWCKKTSSMRPSKRSHGSGKCVWVSLV